MMQDPSSEMKELVRANPVPGLKKIIGFTKLKKNFSQCVSLVSFPDDRSH